MATAGVPEDLFSTLMFGDNAELECFLADDLRGFRDRLQNSDHSTPSTSSPAILPYVFLMGDYEEAYDTAEEAGAGDSPCPRAQPLNAEYIEKLEEFRVEESGSVCSICLDELSRGSMAKRLPCSHVFHGNCIKEWLKNNNTCPICRHWMP